MPRTAAPEPWQFTITLSAAPPAELTGNKIRRGAWASHLAASGGVREDARKESLGQRPIEALRGSDRLHLRIHVGWPKPMTTRPDLDNTLTGCKHHIDGMFDALEANDNQIDELTVTASLFREHEQNQGFLRAEFTVYPDG